jgi:hypothetical protein
MWYGGGGDWFWCEDEEILRENVGFVWKCGRMWRNMGFVARPHALKILCSYENH